MLLLSDVMEIKVTDEYMGLDEEVRNCQNKEPFENCTTRQYLETVQNQCNCTPYALSDFNKNSVGLFKVEI